MKKMSKQMNIFLWVIQILLALYFIGGGAYMVNHYKFLINASLLNTFPPQIWMALGIFQVLLGMGLVLPGLLKMNSKLFSISAIGLAIISLLGAVLYPAYSGFGILWAIVPAILLILIAYKRK